jgi:hypothetical protein
MNDLPSSPADQGRLLERRVADHFAAAGYLTRRNVVLEGRSGGRHEVDVLAEKRDSLTSFTVAVECKAWSTPVDKDVVSKLAYTLSDLGINKGIVVSRAGSRVGADRAAAQLGIELWDGARLERLLGGVIGPHHPVRATGLALPDILDRRQAVVSIRSESRGILRRERTHWAGEVWLPAYELQLATARTTGRHRPRTVLTRQWACYEAVGGNHLWSSPTQLPLETIAMSESVVPPLVQDNEMVKRIGNEVSRLHKVTTAAARARHEEALAQLGVELPVNSVEVVYLRSFHFHAHLALLSWRGLERIIAVPSYDRRVSHTMSTALTGSMAHVLSSAQVSSDGALIRG